MAWELTFEAKKPNRLHRYFWTASVWDDVEPSLWWNDHEGRFLPDGHPAHNEYGCSNCSKPIRTLRAFRRFLRKHPELQGRTVRLTNRFIGFDVEANFNEKSS